MEFPYIVELDPEIAIKVEQVANTLLQTGAKLQQLYDHAEQLKKDIWEEARKDPNIDVDNYIYKFDAETKVLVCEGTLEQETEGDFDLESVLKQLGAQPT